MRYTTKPSKPDIVIEVYEQPSNAILAIEVKLPDVPQQSELQDGLQELISYMVTKVRPIKRDGVRWLLHGLLLHRAVDFLVVLRSNIWLDYPRECVSIEGYDFDNIGWSD